MSRGHLYRRRLADGRPGRWNAVIDLPRTGKRRRQLTRTFDTKTQAQQWLADTIAGRRTIQAEGPTVGEFLTGWLDGNTRLRPSTLASYRAHIDKHLNPQLGHLPLAGLQSHDVERLHHALLAEGISPATLHRIHATLASALAAARRQHLLTGDPLADVNLPRVPVFQPRTWTQTHARTFLTGIHGSEDEALWRLALLTGMRRGEVCGLRWSDIDWDTSTIAIRLSRVQIASDVVVGEPKSTASRRYVPVDHTTLDSLRHLRSWQPVTRMDQHGSTARDWVFTDQLGDPVTPTVVSRRFTRLIQDLQLPRIRLHDLRHTSATLGLAAGESLKEVSTRLGHADIGVTARVYTQIPDQTARASARRLAALLDSPTAALTDGEPA